MSQTVYYTCKTNRKYVPVSVYQEMDHKLTGGIPWTKALHFEGVLGFSEVDPI